MKSRQVKGVRKSKYALVYKDKWYASLLALYRSFENPGVGFNAFRYRLDKGWDAEKAALSPGTRGRKSK